MCKMTFSGWTMLKYSDGLMIIQFGHFLWLFKNWIKCFLCVLVPQDHNFGSKWVYFWLVIFIICLNYAFYICTNDLDLGFVWNVLWNLDVTLKSEQSPSAFQISWSIQSYSCSLFSFVFVFPPLPVNIYAFYAECDLSF